MGDVVVLGGGLTGLVAAERLAALGVRAQVYDREPEPGGACRSFEQKGFTFDLTGHLLHARLESTREYLEALGVWGELDAHIRRSAVVLGGRVTPYPIQIHTHRLSPEVRRECLLGFIRAWARFDESTEPTSFSDWVRERFGEGLAEHFFFPYNRKLFRAEPEELSVDWVGRYVPRPELEDVVDGALGLHRADVGYNARFHYPRIGGIRALTDAVARRVPDLRLRAEVVGLSLKERWIEVENGERHGFDRLIVTGSLPHTVDRIVDELPEEIRAARRALRWVRVVNVGLGVRGEAPSDHHWLYFPDPGIPFYRVGFPSNHGQLAPPGSHTVSIEVSLDPSGDDPQEAAAAAEASLAESGRLDAAAVATRRVAVLDPAYVVFDHARADAVEALRRMLAERGVLLAGRWAEWKYSAMEDAIVDGARAARLAASGAA